MEMGPHPQGVIDYRRQFIVLQRQAANSRRMFAGHPGVLATPWPSLTGF